MMSGKHTKVEGGYRRWNLERQPAPGAILPQDPSVFHFQSALCSTLGPHPLPRQHDVHLCSRFTSQPHGYFRRKDSRRRRLYRRGRREREKEMILSPELSAYLKCLIYTAAFKDPFAEPRGAIYRQFISTGWIPLPGWRAHFARGWRSSWRFGMPSSQQARSVAVPRIRHPRGQERTVGEVQRWMIPTYKMRFLAPDLRLVVLVVRA